MSNKKAKARLNAGLFFLGEKIQFNSVFSAKNRWKAYQRRGG